MICPITDKPCRTNGCGEKCYKRDSLGYSTASQHDAKLPVRSDGFEQELQNIMKKKRLENYAIASHIVLGSTCTNTKFYNQKTKNMKLVKIDSYLFLIDEEAKIKEGDYRIMIDKTSVLYGQFEKHIGTHECNEQWCKIIAYYPLTKEAKELDLPLLPPFEDNFNDLEWNDIADEDWKSRGGEGNRSHFMYRQGYIHGAYKALQTQSKQFSLEDILNFRKVLEEGALTNMSCASAIVEFDKFIQSLSTQQLPKKFYPYLVFNEKGITQPQIITNSEGKQEIQGTYKY